MKSFENWRPARAPPRPSSFLNLAVRYGWGKIEPLLAQWSELASKLLPFLRHDRTSIELIKRNDFGDMRFAKTLQHADPYVFAGSRLVKLNDEIAIP